MFLRSLGRKYAAYLRDVMPTINYGAEVLRTRRVLNSSLKSGLPGFRTAAWGAILYKRTSGPAMTADLRKSPQRWTGNADSQGQMTGLSVAAERPVATCCASQPVNNTTDRISFVHGYPAQRPHTGSGMPSRHQNDRHVVSAGHVKIALRTHPNEFGTPRQPLYRDLRPIKAQDRQRFQLLPGEPSKWTSTPFPHSSRLRRITKGRPVRH
jgi:hypothetical protein